MRDQFIERVAELMQPNYRSALSPTDQRLLGGVATAIVDMLAGEVEALQAEDARLREALKTIILMTDEIWRAPLVCERWADRIEDVARAALADPAAQD